MSYRNIMFYLCTGFLSVVLGCDGDPAVPIGIQPVFTTDKLSTPDASTISLWAQVDKDQYDILRTVVDEYGFVWSDHPENSLDNATAIRNTAPFGQWRGFSAGLRDLKSNTRFFVRAYMIVDGKTFYANEVSFVTRPGSWKRLKDFPGTGFINSTSFTLNNNAFVVTGGQVWRYDPSSDEWTRKNDFPVITKGPTSFVIDGIAYVYCATLYQYKEEQDSWTPIPPPVSTYMARGCNGVGSFVVDGRAYIGSGFGNLNLGFIYNDPRKQTWGTMEFSHQAPNVAYAAVFAVNNVGYVMGGAEQVGASMTSQVLTYDVRESKWTRSVLRDYHSGLEIERNSMLTFVIGNDAYAGMGYGDGGIIDFFCRLNNYTMGWERQTIAIEEGENSTRFYPRRSGGVAFSIGGKGYVGMGEMTQSGTRVLLTDVWEFTPD